MEGSDPFTQGVETGPDDPFAGTDFGDFEQHDPDAPPPATENGTGELKTVDREGVEVTGDAAPEAVADPTPAGPAPESAGPTEAKSDPTESSTGSSPAPPASDSSEPGGTASASTESAPAAPEADTPASTAAVAEASAEQAGGDQGDPTPASPEPPTTDATSSSSSSGSDEAEEDAPPPEEPTDARGRATKRRYVILRVDGPGKFTQVHWYEGDDGKMLTKREPGSKRQTVALCKSAEEALKIGFAACGGPQDGVNLVATAALHFQPKVVKPMPPEPSKQRLQIS